MTLFYGDPSSQDGTDDKSGGKKTKVFGPPLAFSAGTLHQILI